MRYPENQIIKEGRKYAMPQNEIIFKLIGLLLGIVGSLLLFGGGLVVYIFKRHVSDNDCQFAKNRDEHIRIFDKIEEKADRKR